MTYAELHRDPDAALGRIVDRYHQVAEKADAVVVVGSDYTDVGAPTEFSFNARVAANLGTPVMLVLNAHGKTPEALRATADVAAAELKATSARCSRSWPTARPLPVATRRSQRSPTSAYPPTCCRRNHCSRRPPSAT